MTTPTDPAARTSAATLEDAQEDQSRRRLRRAKRYVVGFGVLNVIFFPGLALIGLFTYPAAQDHFWLMVVGVPLSLVQAVLVHWIYRLRFGLPSRFGRGTIVWSSVVPLVVLCLIYGFTPLSAVYLAFWWGVVMLVATRAEALVITALLLVLWTVAGVILLPLAPTWEVLFVYFYGLGMAGLTSLTNRVFGTMWDIVADSHDGRLVRARLAVTEERQRIARDLHDLLGHSLSGIAVKSELAARLAQRDPERAAAEMLTVQALARDALREMRATVSNYRELDLGVEIGNVRQVLSAGGTQCTVSGSDVEMTATNRGLAAWVVREAVTNILRHSNATHCDIALSRQGELAVVEVYNDGVTNGERDPKAGASGSGLRGLTERVAAVGGTLTANATDDGGFLLRALLPDAAISSPTGDGHGATPNPADPTRSVDA